MKRLGENIKKFRKEKCLTQIQLGELIGTGGTAVVNYEKGYCCPPCQKLPKIAKVLGVSMDELFEGCYED